MSKAVKQIDICVYSNVVKLSKVSIIVSEQLLE